MCCALLAIGTTALAEPQHEVTAEAMFVQARQAMDAGNYREACTKFAESQRLDPAAGTLMNLATCEQKLGKLASAWQHWKEAIDSLPAGDDRIAFARDRVRELEKRLPRLTVTLAPGTDATARVLRDEVELGVASRGEALPVDPGDHTLVVSMAGRLPEKTSVSIGEAEEKQIEVHVGAPDPAFTDRGKGGSTAQTVGWIVGGVGAAAAVAAGVTWGMLSADKSTVEANCTNKVCANQKGVDAATSGKTLVVVNGVALGVAAIGLGLGGYFILSSKPDRSITALLPSLAPGGAAVGYLRTF